MSASYVSHRLELRLLSRQLVHTNTFHINTLIFIFFFFEYTVVSAVSEALSMPAQSITVPRYENCCCGPGPFQKFPGRMRDQREAKLCDGKHPFWLLVARDSATISATPAGLSPQPSSDEPPSPSSSGAPGQAGISLSATRVAVGSSTLCSLAERQIWLTCQGWVLEGTSSLCGWAWLHVAAAPTSGIKGSCGDIIRKNTLQALQQIKLLPLPITAAVDPPSVPQPVCGEWPRNSSGVRRNSQCRHFWNMFPMFWAGVGFPSSFPFHLAPTNSDGYGQFSPIRRQAVLHSMIPRRQSQCLHSHNWGSWHGRRSWNGSVLSAVPALTFMGLVLSLVLIRWYQITSSRRQTSNNDGSATERPSLTVRWLRSSGNSCEKLWRLYTTYRGGGGSLSLEAMQQVSVSGRTDPKRGWKIISDDNDSANNKNFFCLLSSIQGTAYIQIPIKISLKLRYWIIQWNQLSETHTSWLITHCLPLTHRKNLTLWVHVPNHTWNLISYATT